MKIIASVKNLSKFERGLWLASVIVVILSFLCSKSGDVLTLISSLIGVTALIFLAKGYVLGMILSVVFSVFYGIVSFYFHYYGEMITYLCMTSPMAIISVISWIKNPYKDTAEVKVNKLEKRHIVVMIVLAAVVTGIFYFILKYLGNANLIVSTFSITTSFVGAYLTFYRSPFYALGYSLNDIVLIVLWVLATIESLSYLPMVFCFVMFLVNDLYALYNWHRIKNRQTEIKKV